MSVNYRNTEGYADPTAFGALSAIAGEEKTLRKYRPLVYVCSPYAGDVSNNVENARKYSRFAVDAGYIPLTPHLLFPQFLNDGNVQERQLGQFFGNVLLIKCMEMWVFGSRITLGMEDEIEYAERKHIPVRYFSDDCVETERTV